MSITMKSIEHGIFQGPHNATGQPQMSGYGAFNPDYLHSPRKARLTRPTNL